MGTFRRYDCPYLMQGHSMCKNKMNAVMDRTDLTYNQKMSAMQIKTCSGCEIYKNLKKCGKPQKNKKMPNGERRKSMKNITITKNSTVKAIGHRSHGSCKPVYCITTGRVYASALDAAEELGVSHSVLSMAASGKLKTCKGERYCYVSQVMNYLEEIAECSRVRAEKVAAYDKIVGKQQKENALAERKAKLAKMKEKLEKEAAAIAAEEQALNEV